MSTLLTAFVSSITNIQNDAESQTRVPLPPLIEDILAIFSCTKTFHTGHRYHPPKFVFLESEDDPPWKPHDLRYYTMSLEEYHCNALPPLISKSIATGYYVFVVRKHLLFLINVVHQSLFFLRAEPKLPWEPGDPRYLTMSLEDKARFQDGSIDMCMKTTSKPRSF
nr:hypothetical protein [Tanacetum cinerariifolium]